ncbi:MAG TPA: CAP domain-containing protein [Actinomycetota bacterium]|nr:CAP domain-containing protein [Actinomycetota bacterium]
MKTLRQIVTVATTAALLVIFVPASTSTASAACSRGWAYRDAETSFAARINHARATAGQGNLRLDKELSKAARRHTREMLESNTLYHTPAPALKNRVTNWTWLGENVGVGNTVDSLHVAFMNSPDHRDNILFSKFRHIGIGTRMQGGRMWVTVLFEAKTDPGTTLPMPTCKGLISLKRN